MRIAAVIAALFCYAQAHADVIVNIDARQSGFEYPGGGGSDPAPVPGQVITPIGTLNQQTFAAGSYTITNATGLAGANPSFTGWQFNGGASWVWNFVIADDATHQVVFYADAGGIQSSQAAIAAQPDVQSFSGTFSLASSTTLDFMVRDFFLGDNAGGVALDITSAVPEPGTLALLASGLGGLGLRRKRIRGRSPNSQCALSD